MGKKIYIAIDLKSFYASVECRERNFDPMTTNLVVADASRTEKTICLAVSPSLKAYGIPGRCAFIHDVIKPTKIPARFPHKVSIHNSCHGVRELFLSAPSELNIPYFNKLRDLLQMVEGIEVFEPSHVDECCGFGGMFAVEEQAVSVCMGRDKIRHHMETGAEYITGADSSCLMHMQGIIEREHLPIRMIHVVEILASQL